MQLQQQQQQSHHHLNGDHVNHLMNNSGNAQMNVASRGHHQTRAFADGHHPMDLSSPQPQHYDHMNHRQSHHFRNHSHEGKCLPDYYFNSFSVRFIAFINANRRKLTSFKCQKYNDS
jgi:hypothetical protein